MKRRNNVIIYIFSLILNIIVIYLSSDFAYSEGADLHSFLFDVNDLWTFDYEPLFSILLIPFQYLAKNDLTSWVPSALVSLSISIVILKSPIKNTHLKLFWIFCLILPMSLVNFRVGSAFILILIIPFRINYWGLFTHWTYVFLIFDEIKLKIKHIFALAFISIVYLYFFADSINTFQGKVDFYIEGTFKSTYAYFVFLETLLLSILYKKIYGMTNQHSSAQIAIITTSLITQFFSLYVVSARLNSLSIALSLINLRDKEIKKLSIIDIIIIYSVSIYHISRFSVNIPNTGLWDLIH